MNVLFVEDHEDTRELLCELLASAGHAVTGVGSAERALEELHRGRFDLVVTDHWLDPGETGAWLLHQMAREGIHLPAVMCTAERTPPDVPEGVTIVKKPVDVDRLLGEIERAHSAFVARDREAPALERAASETKPTATESGITKLERPGILELVLYITRSQASMRGLRNLRRVLDSYASEDFELEVVDVSDGRDESATGREPVTFTPMLVKRGPGPRERLLGDLADVSALEDLFDRLGIERIVCVA